MRSKGNEIIEQILQYLDVKAPTFAEEIGVKYQRIFDIQQGKTKKVSADVANLVVARYPEFSIEWLLTGEGEMLKENKKINTQSAVSNDVTMSREIFDLLKNQSETILSQQRTIEKLADREKTSTAGAV